MRAASRPKGQAARLVRRLDAEGAVSHRGQEDDGLRAREQLDWHFPDWIIYPTGGGTGMVGMWKAFDELERIGWKDAAGVPYGLGPGRTLRADRPRLRTRRRAVGAVAERQDDRRRSAVPKAVGDFLVLRHGRESGGTALAVTDAAMVARCARWAAAKASARRRRRRGARGTETPRSRRPGRC